MNNIAEKIRETVNAQTNADISTEKAQKLADFLEYLLQENEKYNLTAIKDVDKAIVLHLADSLTVSDCIPAGSVCDIGAGAGFPSLPLAVCRDDLKLTPVDATLKKVNFINAVSDRLQLSNCKAVNGRAEELFGAHSPLRETYDTVIARAVAPLNVLCELCAPALRVGGQFIAMKGENAEDELSGFEKCSSKLGLTLSEKKCKQLTMDGEIFTRYILIFRKSGHSGAQFPRSFGQIKKKPLF